MSNASDVKFVVFVAAVMVVSPVLASAEVSDDPLVLCYTSASPRNCVSAANYYQNLSDQIVAKKVFAPSDKDDFCHALLADGASRLTYGSYAHDYDSQESKHFIGFDRNASVAQVMRSGVKLLNLVSAGCPQYATSAKKIIKAKGLSTVAKPTTGKS